MDSLFKKLQILDLNKFGNKLFLVGIFFLATTPFISILLLLPSAILGAFNRKDKFLKDIWNYPFITTSILMIISCFMQTWRTYDLPEYDIKLSFIGLLNWIPLFFCFWGFQPYLSTKKSRQNTLLLLVMGTIPVLITGLGQYFFKWYGPFETLNGLIIWFQRPIDINIVGLTGLFNNQNYAGSWLSIIFSMSLTFALVKDNRKFKKIIALVVFLFLSLTTILTYSRNSLFALIFSILFFIKSKRFTLISIFFIITIVLIFLQKGLFNTDNFFVLSISHSFEKLFNILPIGLSNKLQSIINFNNSPRTIIWGFVINLIWVKKYFGWGAGSFPILFEPFDYTNINAQHTHNLPFEIAFNYGLPSAIILISSLFFLTFKNNLLELNIKREYRLNKENIFDTGWKTSANIFLVTHLFDITYFDSRISILSWILFAGMRNIIRKESI